MSSIDICMIKPDGEGQMKFKLEMADVMKQRDGLREAVLNKLKPNEDIKKISIDGKLYDKFEDVNVRELYGKNVLIKLEERRGFNIVPDSTVTNGHGRVYHTNTSIHEDVNKLHQDLNNKLVHALPSNGIQMMDSKGNYLDGNKKASIASVTNERNLHTVSRGRGG